MTYIWSFIAALCAVGAEYLYRRLSGSWISHLYLWIPIQLLIGYCIYRLVSAPNTPLIGALIMWSFTVIGLRVFISAIILKDIVPVGTWVAVGLMIMARVAQAVWK